MAKTSIRGRGEGGGAWYKNIEWLKPVIEEGWEGRTWYKNIEWLKPLLEEERRRGGWYKIIIIVSKTSARGGKKRGGGKGLGIKI